VDVATLTKRREHLSHQALDLLVLAFDATALKQCLDKEERSQVDLEGEDADEVDPSQSCFLPVFELDPVAVKPIYLIGAEFQIVALP